MASGQEKFLTDNIEERLARRVIERFSLTPPINVTSLIRKYADFEEVVFPVEIDGLSLNIKSSTARTQVMVAAGLPETRKRFTIAHELGHVVIPWHVGSIVDDISAGRESSTNRYREKEAEANRFAAELLMPYAWTRDILDSAKTFMAGVEIIADRARVSMEAAALRAQRIGPPNVIVAVSNGNKITRVGRTPGTRANVPKVDTIFSKSLVDPHSEYSIATASTGAYHAWRIQDSAELPKKPKKTSKELLTEIFADLGYTGDRSLWSSVHGIVAVANGSVRENRTREKIYSAILHNIHNRQDSRPQLRKVLAHRKFEKFAIARAYEFDV